MATRHVPNPSARFQTRIELSDDPQWSGLLPSHLEPFNIQESLRPCSAYPDGVQPGFWAAPGERGEPCQATQVLHFPNYREWSRITLDDVVEIPGKGRYLTTHFFQARRRGWSSPEFRPKPGSITLGYCFNGSAYSPDPSSRIDQVVYGLVYATLIRNNPLFKRLTQICAEADVTLVLSHPDADAILSVLARLLTVTSV